MITLVLGGARSGKSAVAEARAARTGVPVTYVATVVAVDEEMAARIAVHRSRRPAPWQTVEVPDDLPGCLRELTGTVVVDALGPWVADHVDEVDVEGLCRALTARAGDSVIVSEEVGLGVHPSTAVGRRFRDALGQLNQRVAAVSDEVLFVVAGRALRLEPSEVP